MTVLIENMLEGILFYKAEPLSARDLSKLSGVSVPQVREALGRLYTRMQGTGLMLIEDRDQFLLTTTSEVGERIQELFQEELEAPLSKVALETLSIILYHPRSITKVELDFIRGVNTNYILRVLLTRGLIDKIPNPDDRRRPFYRATLDTLATLGIASLQELPDYGTVSEEFASITNEHDTHE